MIRRSMTSTTAELTRRIPKWLAVLIVVGLSATAITRYLVLRSSDPALQGSGGSGATAVAVFTAGSHRPSDLRVAALNAVPLDYTYTYEVYHSRGYSVCPASSHRAYLHLRRPVDCRALFKQVLADQNGQLLPQPPQFMPSIFKKEYLLDGHAELQSEPRSDVYNGNPEPLDWTKEYVDDLVVRTGKREHFNYGEWSQAVYNSLANVDIKGQRGLVVGSESPWVEAAILHAGAAHVTTSEYREIKSAHPQISAYHPRDQAKQFLDGELEPYDLAFSYSSLEHSGLGRYGDPLDPNGDLKETAKLSCLVKPGGLLLLGLPFNSDAVVFNSHRLYGPVRLPLMTANWAVQNVFTKDTEKPIDNLTPYFYTDVRDEWHTQLVIVAKNNRESPCSVSD